VAHRGRRDLGRLQAASGATVTVTLRDANTQAVDSKTAVANAYGSAAGEFPIPAGRALGSWRLETSPPGSAHVQVEEYKRPTFEVKWKDPETALRLNRPAELSGTARYYFGLPVSSGKVAWRVTRSPEYPWWWGYFRGGTRAGEQVIAQGKSDLSADGTFRIRFTPAADERLGKDGAAVTYRYEAVAEATDEGGETRSDERTFRLGFVAVSANVAPETGFFREAAPGSVTITRSDLDGTPRAGKGSWRLSEIAQPAKVVMPAEVPIDTPREDRYATPGDKLRPRWDTHQFQLEAVLRRWPDGRERSRGELTHDAKGEARLTLPGLPAGAWRLRYETTDPFGAKFETTRDFLVVGKSVPVKVPGLLLVERGSVPVGGTARLLAGSGLAGQTVFVATPRRPGDRAPDPGARRTP
jgi:hypothetical protein